MQRPTIQAQDGEADNNAKYKQEQDARYSGEELTMLVFCSACMRLSLSAEGCPKS